MQSSTPQEHPSAEQVSQPQHQTQLTSRFQHLISQHPHLDLDQIFYLQASKLYQDLVDKQEQIQRVQTEISTLRSHLGLEPHDKKRHAICLNSHPSDMSPSEKRKRMRRTAVEIARHYICTIDKCNKSYGSEGSLNQHIKLKHHSHYAQHMLMMEQLPPQQP